jgi:hypothetical protein
MGLLPGIIFLREDEQALIEALTSRRVVNGPGRVVTPALSRVRRRKGVILEPTDYLILRDTLTGELRMETGPRLAFLSATEEVVRQEKAITLKQNQYMRVLDKSTGEVRVERGEAVVYLRPTEEILESPRDGVNVDEHTAVLIRGIDSGQYDLITTPQVFIPSADQQVVEVRQRILLEDHQTVVIRDKDGRYMIRRGTDAERSFFLQPYETLVMFYWSSGLDKSRRELRLTHIDLRPQYMWYDFAVRTQDNVELIIGITFFWQIVDVEQMILTTGDTTGDVCAHARSRIIQSVSRVTLERFLAEFNVVVGEAVLNDDEGFYAARGARLLAVEVRYIQCKDPATQQILQDIIQETTNRINRLQKQESENEVRLRQVQGEIESERQRAALLEIQRENARLAGMTEGENEAERLLAFITRLGDAAPLENKIALFNTLRKGEALKTLSGGRAQLFFTPSDVDLSIKAE